MTGRVVFIAGFPGFLAHYLLEKLLEEQHEERFELLVESHLLERASKMVERLAQRLPGTTQRVSFVAGDISSVDLGLNNATLERLRAEVTVVYQLAAIYDLAVPKEIAERINVVGTQNVLDFCARLSKLERLIYFSTCHVCGKRLGRILESELDAGQGFKNFYESTKFAAELLVQQRWNQIPTTIIRPAIVVGHSKTGATDKYDGLYFPMKLTIRMPRWLPTAYLGSGEVPVNLVPIDYVIDGAVAIAARPDAAGKVFALADPSPNLVREVWRLMLEMTGHRSPGLTVPMSLVKWSMQPRFVRRYLQIPLQALDYFEHYAEFDCSNTLGALAGTGISCPRIPDYLPTLLKFASEHPWLDQLREQIY